MVPRAYWRSVTYALHMRHWILPKILPVVAATTSWAALIVTLNRLGIVVIVVEDKLISMLGIALAFLLAFRTNRAFDRYWQGAQLWTTLSIQARNLSRQIWNGIKTPTPESFAEKLQMMRMILAVAVATKCALREGSAKRPSRTKRSTTSHANNGPHQKTGGISIQGSSSSTSNASISKRGPLDLDPEVVRLLPQRYFGVTTWRESMVDLTTTKSGTNLFPDLPDASNSETLSPQPISASTNPSDAGIRKRSKRVSRSKLDVDHVSNSSSAEHDAVNTTPRRSERIRSIPNASQPQTTTKRSRKPSASPQIAGNTLDQCTKKPWLSVETSSHHKLAPITESPSPTSTMQSASPTTPFYNTGILQKPFTLSSLSASNMSSASINDYNHTASNTKIKHFPMYDRSGNLVINTPLDIVHRIGYYIRRQRTNKLVDPEDTPTMIQAINTMIDSITKFEQILNVPMPRSYDLHMKQILILHFLALPFQLIKYLRWFTVLAAAIVSFAYFGADSIAEEIEEPFGFDPNDLPLDYFCERLRGDIEYIMERSLMDENESPLEA